MDIKVGGGRQGLPGPKGDTGLTGATGPPGGNNYIHTQALALSTWTVVHNLGRYASNVRLVGNDNSQFQADVTDIDLNTILVGPMTSPVSGKAYVS